MRFDKTNIFLKLFAVLSTDFLRRQRNFQQHQKVLFSNESYLKLQQNSPKLLVQNKVCLKVLIQFRLIIQFFNFQLSFDWFSLKPFKSNWISGAYKQVSLITRSHPPLELSSPSTTRRLYYFSIRSRKLRKWQIAISSNK